MTVIIDLDDIDDPEPFQFRFGGEVYTVPSEPSLVALAAFDRGDILDFLAAMLGAEQWERIQASPAVLSVTKIRPVVGQYLGRAPEA